MAAHAIKGGRWVTVSGSALDVLVHDGALRIAGLLGQQAADACLPSSGVGALVPCKEPRTNKDIVITVRMWPLHSDVAVRGAVKLVPLSAPETEATTDADTGAGQGADSADGWSVGNINALQNAIVRTHFNNLHSIPQDCPHREQRGWGGDAQLTAGSASLNFDLSAFYGNWLQTMQDMQIATNGDLPSYVPRDPAQGDSAPAWAAIAAVVPWEHYTRTGDKALVHIGLNTTKLLVGFWQKHLDPKTGLLDIAVYGDWAESPRAGKAHAWGTGAECPKMLAIHGTYVECLDRGVDLATAAGDTDHAAEWGKMATSARAAVEARWWNATHGCYSQSCKGQTAQALPFALNITTPRHRPQAIAALVESVTSWNTSYIAGIIGARFLQEALVEAGRGDLALKLVGRDATACSGTVSCTWSQQLQRGQCAQPVYGPHTSWASWVDGTCARAPMMAYRWSSSQHRVSLAC